MSHNVPYHRRFVLLRPLVLTAAGVAVLGVSLWLGRTGGDDAPLPQLADVKPELAQIAPTQAPQPNIAQAPPATPHTSTQATVQAPSFDIVRVNPAGDAVVAGRAAPGADVAIIDNGREIGRAVADIQGQFVFLSTTPLPVGGQELSLTSHQGGAETKGEGSVVLIVPDRVSVPPATGPGTPSTAVAVLTSPDAAPRVLQGPAAGQGARLGLDVVDYDAKGAIRFAGSAPPGAVVRLYVDNRPVGDARSDPQGHWNMRPDNAIAAGDHALRLDQLSNSGRVEIRIELRFQRAVIPEQDVPQDRVVVQPRQNLWRIARRVYGRGVMYTEIYQANRGQIRDPGLIFPGQVFAIPTVANSAPANSRPENSTPSASNTSR
jgi:nucleoid-associated protein YgaU